MSKKRTTQKMKNQPDSTNNSPCPKKGEEKQHSKKTFERISYALPVIFFVASIVSLFICFPSFWKCHNESDKYYANQSLIITDTLGQKHFAGEGCPILIANNASIILNEDSIEIGDSLLSQLNGYLTSDSLGNNYVSFQKEEDNKKDSIPIAITKRNLELHSKNNAHVLYARKGERFLVHENSEKEDSICILFNNDEYWTTEKTIVEKKAKNGRTIREKEENLTVCYTSIQEYDSIPFAVEYFISDSVEKKVALRLNFEKKNETEDDSLNNTSIRIYHIYSESLLCNIQKSDSTYLIDVNKSLNSSDSCFLRADYNGKLSYVLTASNPITLCVNKESLNKSKKSGILKSLVIGILSILFVLSLINLLHYLYKKRKNRKKVKALEENIQNLENELQKEFGFIPIRPNNPSDYKTWFDGLDSQKGNLGLYDVCKDYLDKWCSESETQELDCNKNLKNFEENLDSFLDSVMKSSEETDIVIKKVNQLKEKKKELSDLIETLDKSNVTPSPIFVKPNVVTENIKPKEQLPIQNALKKEVDNYDVDNYNKLNENYNKLIKDYNNISNKNEELLARLKKTEQDKNEEIKKAKEKAKQESDELVRNAEDKAKREIGKAEERTKKANERADAAEKKSREIRQEVTDQFKEEIQDLNDQLKDKQEKITQTTKALNQTTIDLKAKEKECVDLTREIYNKTEALKSYSSRITDVLPAGSYAKQIEKLLQIGNKIEKSADALLGKDFDDYLLTKYITRYQSALHLIDMNQFATDVLNIANVQFVYNQQPIAKYNQKDEKQFKESMKLFFYESYLEKYINALMVFNETMAGLHHLVDGMKENDTKVFGQYRNELMNVFKELELEVHSVKIFDSITDNVDLRVEMRPLDFNCSSGTICQINSCLVYLAGGNKPNDKIHVIVKE